jgi:DNA-binding response OmpR family regulator
MANILIVDDQPCVRELVSEELVCEGCRIARAGDAESVRRHLRSSRPDLVLLDLYLDGPEGFEILRDIKRQDPYLPVIIFTAYDSFMDDPRVSQADGYVIKSFDFMELKQKIAEVLRRKPAHRAEVEAKTQFRPSPVPLDALIRCFLVKETIEKLL